MGTGYIGYNIGSVRRKLKTQADLFCHFFSMLNILSQLRVAYVMQLCETSSLHRPAKNF
jgi:hypothetical protein